TRDLAPDRAALAGARLAAGRHRRAARAHDGAGAPAVGSHRALPRHPGHPRQPADVLVLRAANHLLVEHAGAPEVQVLLRPEPVLAPRDFLPGDPVLSRERLRALEVAARARRRVDWRVLRRLLGVRPVARLVRRGGVTCRRPPSASRTSRSATAGTAAVSSPRS